MELIQALIDGILLGGVYGIISLGLSLVFGVMGIVNFAHAEFMMLGMYASWFLWHHFGIDPILGSLLSGTVVAALGLCIEKGLIQPILTGPPSAQIALTAGLMIALENAALLAFGSDFRSVTVPYQSSSYRLGPIFLSAPYVYAFLASVVVGVSLWLFLSRSWTGRAIRATAQDSMAATLSGVDSQRIFALTFAVGVGLSAVGGGIILPYLTVSPSSGSQFAVLMFTVVVLGGLGNVGGALIGGLIVGVVQSISTLVLPVNLQNIVLFIVFIAVLALRPEGILKTR